MPVTKTAKRALRASIRKGQVDKKIISNLEIVIRKAKKGKKAADILSAISFSDKAAKKHIIHKNKAARIKSRLAKLLPMLKSVKKSVTSKGKKAKK